MPDTDPRVAALLEALAFYANDDDWQDFRSDEQAATFARGRLSARGVK